MHCCCYYCWYYIPWDSMALGKKAGDWVCLWFHSIQCCVFFNCVNVFKQTKKKEG